MQLNVDLVIGLLAIATTLTGIVTYSALTFALKAEQEINKLYARVEHLENNRRSK